MLRVCLLHSAGATQRVALRSMALDLSIHSGMADLEHRLPWPLLSLDWLSREGAQGLGVFTLAVARDKEREQIRRRWVFELGLMINADSILDKIRS